MDSFKDQGFDNANNPNVLDPCSHLVLYWDPQRLPQSLHLQTGEIFDSPAPPGEAEKKTQTGNRADRESRKIPIKHDEQETREDNMIGGCKEIHDEVIRQEIAETQKPLAQIAAECKTHRATVWRIGQRTGALKQREAEEGSEQMEVER